MKLDYEYVYNFYNEHGCVLLETEYVSNSTPMRFICSCGKEYVKRFDKFKNNPFCYYCGKLSSGSKNRIPYNKIKEEIKENGCELITKENEYKGISYNIKFICSCGNIGTKLLADFRKHPHCKICGERFRYENARKSYEEISNIVDKEGCFLLTTKEEYINMEQKVNIKCDCGNIFNTSIESFIRENKRQCDDCTKLKTSGENSALWNGGTSSERDIIKSSLDYKIWRSKVYERDDYTCVCCGKKNKRLNAHHLYGFSEYPPLRTCVANGITLCEECHNPSKINSFHYVYGAKNFYPEDLYEYIQRHQAGEFDETG